MYFQKLEESLLHLCNHLLQPLHPPSPVQDHFLEYTDGSCVNNRVISQDNPVGWGFTVSNVYRDYHVNPIPTSQSYSLTAASAPIRSMHGASDIKQYGKATGTG